MIVKCAQCSKPLETGDRVTAFIAAWYKEIPSKIAYALFDHDMQVDKASLTHYSCWDPKNEA